MRYLSKPEGTIDMRTKWAIKRETTFSLLFLLSTSLVSVSFFPFFFPHRSHTFLYFLLFSLLSYPLIMAPFLTSPHLISHHLYCPLFYIYIQQMTIDEDEESSSSSMDLNTNYKHKSTPHHPAIVMEFKKDKMRDKDGQKGTRK